MLAQLVRPLVRTQIQMLAQTPSANPKLVGMISQWLGYLGVRAEVNRLQTRQDTIQLSITVSRPDQCTDSEWRQILNNISIGHHGPHGHDQLTYTDMSPAQRSKVHRLLAHVLRAGTPGMTQVWEDVQPQLAAMDMHQELLLGIRSALKVPVALGALVQDLDPEAAAFALSRAITIALMDRQINAAEDDALKALYQVLQEQA